MLLPALVASASGYLVFVALSASATLASVISVPWLALALSPVLFVLGYLFLGSLMLATAAAQSPQREPAEARDKSAPVSADDTDKPPAPVFTPSEKIRADSAVSFPVDI